MVAGRRDGRGRARVEAFRAARLPRSRMRAERLVEADIERLLEGADRLAGLEHRRRDGVGIAGVGAQIALPLLRRREQRRPAGEVEDQVAFGSRAVARAGQREFAAPAGLDLADPVDAQAKPAERARGLRQLSGDDLEAAVERQVVVRVGQQRGHRERSRQKFRGREHHGRLADHQAAALGLDVDGARRGRRQQRLGDQRGLLGAGPVRLVRPAGTVADIDETGHRGADLLGELLEAGAFLLARDDRVAVGDRLRRVLDLGRAQRVVDTRAHQVGIRPDRVAVDRLAPQAIAENEGPGQRVLPRCVGRRAA